MQWYWWVLIGVGVVVIGFLKLKVLQGMMKKKQKDDEDV